MFDILKEVHFVYEPSKLWRYVLEQSCKTLQAEAGSFFVTSVDGEQMELSACWGVDESRLKEVPFKIGMGIAGWVLHYQQPALVNDVESDHRFNRQADVVTGVRTQSILCVPVFSQKTAYGVLELVNRRNGQFGPQDQEFMTILGRQTAIAYHNLLMLNELSQTKVLMQSLVESFSGGLITINAGTQLTLINPAAERLLHLATGDKAGKSIDLILKDHPWVAQVLRQTLTDKTAVSRQEILALIEGQSCRVGYTTMLIADQQKQILGSGILFQRLSV